MPNYKRLFIPNSFVFITITTNFRRPLLIDNIDALRLAFKKVKAHYSFEIIASVILPEHMHILLKPENIYEYPKIIRAIKYAFSKLLQDGGIVIPPYVITNSKESKGEKGIWQRRFIEHTIRDENDLHRHLDYIHYNPVKHELTQNVKDWKYSSFYNFVKTNNYDENWGTSTDIKEIINLEYE